MFASSKINQMRALTYTTNMAGMILLSKYYRQLFQRLDLMNKHNLPGLLSPYRAASALHFLFRGNQKQPKQSDTLINLMCGISENQTWQHIEYFSVEEEMIIEGMLSLAMSFWPKTHNQNIDFFRKTYLNRPATISCSEEGWTVKMDAHPTDEINRLLGSYVTSLMLPWMKTPVTLIWPGAIQ